MSTIGNPSSKPAADAPPDAVATSMQAQATAVKARQAATRAAARSTTTKAPVKAPVKAPAKPKTDARIAALVAWRKSAQAPDVVLEVVDAAIRRGTSAPRVTALKAEPAEVKAWFTATGLTRKEIAAAVGVTTSVIGTVQKQNGDRWSQARFEAAKPLILAAAKAKAKPAKTAK